MSRTAGPAVSRSSYALRRAVVWDVLAAALEQLEARGPLDVLDAGGGTGGFAVPLARRGHRVTVVDPSPDSLAALQRRAAEAGVGASISAVQGDLADGAADWRRVLGDNGYDLGYDLVLCHNVLEVLDDPAAAVTLLTGMLRPTGVASILAANRMAAVVSRALAGRFDEALAVLDDDAGRWGPTDPVARRFTLSELEEMLGRSGLEVVAVSGVRVVADLVPSGPLDAEPSAYDDLLRLERRLAAAPEFQPVAGHVHLLAGWPAPAGGT